MKAEKIPCCIGVIRLIDGNDICHPCYAKHFPEQHIKFGYPRHAIIAAACDYCRGTVNRKAK